MPILPYLACTVWQQMETRMANERYMRSHPEIKAMMAAFTKYVLFVFLRHVPG